MNHTRLEVEYAVPMPLFEPMSIWGDPRSSESLMQSIGAIVRHVTPHMKWFGPLYSESQIVKAKAENAVSPQ